MRFIAATSIRISIRRFLRPEAFTLLTLIRRHVSSWFLRDYHVLDAFRNYPRHVIRYVLRAECDHDGFVLIIEITRHA